MSRVAVAFLIGGCGRVAFDARPDALAEAPPSTGFATLCAFASSTAVHDAVAADDAAGDRMQLALGARCGASMLQRTVSQDTPGVLEPTTNRPLLAADDLGVVGGGDAFQRANKYFFASPAWPITEVPDATNMIWLDRATGQTLLSAPYTALTGTHDYGVVSLLHDTTGGATVITGWGAGAPGTLAAAYLFETAIVPVLETDLHRWYVIEWTNGDADVNPTPGDTLTILGSGF